MELEKQVCSLESARRLKELGVEQHSCFYWHECSYSSAGNKRWWLLDHQGDLCILDSCSAFTVAELGHYLKGDFNIRRRSDRGNWICIDVRLPGFTEHETMAEAVALTLIRLLEHRPTQNQQ